jgi:hypothetical protein
MLKLFYILIIASCEFLQASAIDLKTSAKGLAVASPVQEIENLKISNKMKQNKITDFQFIEPAALNLTTFENGELLLDKFKAAENKFYIDINFDDHKTTFSFKILKVILQLYRMTIFIYIIKPSK